MTELEIRKQIESNYVDWKYLSEFQTLSEPFIREFKDCVYWNWISKFQILSEDFIREFSDYVDWDYISSDQLLSDEFAQEFRDRIKLVHLSYYQRLSKKFALYLRKIKKWNRQLVLKHILQFCFILSVVTFILSGIVGIGCHIIIGIMKEDSLTPPNYLLSCINFSGSVFIAFSIFSMLLCLTDIW